MPELRADCPSCGASLKVSNLALAGKTVKCPKCGERLTLPELDGEPDAADQDEEVDEQPRKVKQRAERDEDDDDRPRKKKRKKAAAGGSSMTRNLIGGGVLLVLLAVAGAVWLSRSKDKDKDTAGGADTTPATGKKPPDDAPGRKSEGPKPDATN